MLIIGLPGWIDHTTVSGLVPPLTLIYTAAAPTVTVVIRVPELVTVETTPTVTIEEL